MAEAFARKYGGDRVLAQSAGLETGEIHPLTTQVMKEAGIDLSQHQSKKIDLKIFMGSNVVVKLCETVKERCPIVPFGIVNRDWDISDPHDQEPLDIEAFRRARDEIEQKVKDLLLELHVWGD